MAPSMTFRGFGLIEQIVTLLVLAVLTAFAIPAFSRMLDTHQLKTAQSGYIAALQHARTLAVNEQRGMLFCPTTDMLTCHRGGDWSDGWLLGRDKGDGTLDGDPLYVGGNDFKRLHIIGSEQKNYVRYRPDGTTGALNQTWYFCVRRAPSQSLVVKLARLGRVRGAVATPEDAAKCNGTTS